jgi:hypothetical protein
VSMFGLTRRELDGELTAPPIFDRLVKDGIAVAGHRSGSTGLRRAGAGGRVIAIEVKASAAPTSADARHLEWLRDQLDDRFLLGLVLHTGPGMYELGDRIAAVPMRALGLTGQAG